MKTRPLGDAAMIVELGSRIDIELSEKAQRLALGLRSHAAVQDAIASYCSVCVYYDPSQIRYSELRTEVQRLYEVDVRAVRTFGRLYRIPIVYDGADLGEVAEALGLTADDVGEIHSGATYRVFLIGFAPGQPYLGPLPARLELPRRSTPRTRVPAGSITIAGRQTNIYPWPNPGGWHVIGHTEEDIVALDEDPPAMFRAGDSVKFEPQ